MIDFTTENALIFSLFQLLLSGVVLLVSWWTLWKERTKSHFLHLPFLIVAYYLYSVHFSLRSLNLLYDFSFEKTILSAPAYETIINALETLALLMIGIAFQSKLPPRRRKAFYAVTLLLFAGASTEYYSFAGDSRTITVVGSAAFSNTLIVVISLLSLFFVRSGSRDKTLVFVSFIALAVSQILSVPLNKTGGMMSAFAWGASNLLKMISFTALALFLEQSRNVYVQFFIRLNLIFIMLACFLMIILTDTQRKQYLAFAELNVQDLEEFLRGHIIYYHKQGKVPEEILGNEQIIRRVVSEFGRIHSLKGVRIYFQQYQMHMSIADDGVVSHDVFAWNPAPGALHATAPGSDQRVVTLVALPIYYEKKLLGHIELDVGLKAINERILKQLQIIFFSFTGFVFLAGVLVGIVVWKANVTIESQYHELEVTQRQLMQAAKLASIGELANGVAHEINNPTGVILARIDYLATVIREQGLSGEFHDDIETIRRQARRISGIVSGLLTFSRPSYLRIQSVDVNEVLLKAISLVRTMLPARGITLDSRISGDSLLIRGDPDRLEQVFINILNNAVDAMPAGGRLTVATGRASSHSKDTAYVAISDTGTGISEENLKKIFDPFFTTKDKGTGLGLSISYGIVRDHEGMIHVQSASGAGSTFQILLPVEMEIYGRLQHSRRG